MNDNWICPNCAAQNNPRRNKCWQCGLERKESHRSSETDHATASKDLSAYKKCPYCGEQILEDAIKCRYCGEFLDGREKAQPVEGFTAVRMDKAASELAITRLNGEILSLEEELRRLRKRDAQFLGWGFTLLFFGLLVSIPLVLGLFESATGICAGYAAFLVTLGSIYVYRGRKGSPKQTVALESSIAFRLSELRKHHQIVSQ